MRTDRRPLNKPAHPGHRLDHSSNNNDLKTPPAPNRHDHQTFTAVDFRRALSTLPTCRFVIAAPSLGQAVVYRHSKRGAWLSGTSGSGDSGRRLAATAHLTSAGSPRQNGWASMKRHRAERVGDGLVDEGGTDQLVHGPSLALNVFRHFSPRTSLVTTG